MKARRTGQILPRGENKWLIRIFLGRDTNGKRHYFSETFIGRKKDAGEHLMNLLTRRKLGEPLRQSESTFDQFLDEWLKVVKLRVRERTLTHYSKMLDDYVREPLGKKRLIDVLPADIQALYDDLLERGLSASTVCFVDTLLTNAFKLALKREKIRKNPMDSVDRPRVERHEMTAMDGEQIRSFLQAALSSRNPALFTLAFYKGARPCEYLALKWTDADMQTGALTIRRSIVWRRAGDWYTTEPKTAKSRRTIPLTAPILAMLQEHRTRQLEDRMRAGAIWQDHGFIFCNEIGEPIPVGSLRYHFKGLLEAAVLPKNNRLYDTRHSCATALIASGLNSKVVSERLGHSNITITLDTYTHVSPGMQKEASEEMEKVILG